MGISSYFERMFYMGVVADLAFLIPNGGFPFFWATDTQELYVYDPGLGWTLVSGGGGGGGHVIEDEGVPLPAEPALNFIGAGVTAADNPGVASNVTIVLTKQIVFKLENTLYIATGGLRITNTLGITLNIQEVELAVSTAPTGASITVDIHKNDVTIFTNQAHRPIITATNFQGTTLNIDVPAWADGDYLTMDIDGIGSVIAGANLVCTIRAVSA